MGKNRRKSSPVLSSTDLLRLRARASLELKNRETHGFRSFVDKVNPRFIWYRVSVVLGNVLERVTAGELKRVMIFEPPRHGKSEEASRLFPAYYMYRYPERKIGISSYAAEIALGLSRDARDYYLRSERSIRADASATREWHNPRGGVLWAAGVGGPITGRGFDLGIIDDPIKNAEEAYSLTIRENQKQWWRSTFYTRAEPNAAIVIIQTRWHEDDLCGWLLQQEREEPQHWHLVILEALKESVKPKIPETCTIEPDWRKLGQALCPERYDEKLLATIKGQVGSQFWSALYQQRPTALEGDVWKRQWFKKFKSIRNLEVEDVGYDWDLAYTENERNSASAYVKAGKDKFNNVYVFDLDFRWLQFPDLIRWMEECEGPHFVEAKASGKSAVQSLKKQEIAAEEVEIQGGADKIARARLASPAAESGHIFVHESVFEKLLDDPRQGLLHFPSGVYSDVNDAFVQMINRLYRPGPPAAASGIRMKDGKDQKEKEKSRKPHQYDPKFRQRRQRSF